MADDQSFLPKLNFSLQEPPNFQNNSNNFNNFANNGPFLPNINMDHHVLDSLKALKQQKTQRIQKKNLEERVYKALEKQTEMLNQISQTFKRQAEKEEARLLKKIKELERENNEILWQRHNEDIIQQKVLEKLRHLNEINSYNFQFNPFYSFLNPMNLQRKDSSESERSEKPKRKKKPKKGKKKVVKAGETAETAWKI